MSVLLTSANDPSLKMFWCPACDCMHGVNVEGRGSTKLPRWQWNGSDDAPTFTPSLLTTYEYGGGDHGPANKVVCHLYVKEGKIEFLSDCTHRLAGQTVQMVAQKTAPETATMENPDTQAMTNDKSASDEARVAPAVPTRSSRAVSSLLPDLDPEHAFPTGFSSTANADALASSPAWHKLTTFTLEGSDQGVPVQENGISSRILALETAIDLLWRKLLALKSDFDELEAKLEIHGIRR